LASRGWSCRDAEQHGTNPGHPGKSGTGGNPTFYTSADNVALPAFAAARLTAGRAATDRYLLSAEPTVANPQQRRVADE